MADEKENEVEFSKGKKGGAKSKFANFATFIWNGETKEFLGRTGKSWALIGVYYLIFYSCLAGFFAINLLVFFTGISDSEPKLQGYNTLLKGHPGMGFRPMISDDNTLISFNQGQNETKNFKTIIEKLDEFLLPYSKDNETNEDLYMDCTGNTNATKDKSCTFDLKEFGPCNKINDYGYGTGQPCVFLKLNKIYGWIPEQFTPNNDTCSKEQCPEVKVADNHIGVTCEGESDADNDFIKDMQFYPKDGFKSNFYPYLNQKGYLSPLVAVQFKVQPGALIMVWCKAWANNIYHHKNDRAGSVHFELLVD